MNTKTCNKCKQEFPKTPEYFYKRERGYLKSSCKPCDIKSNLLWTQKNKEKSRAKSARWKKNNPEKAKESNRKSKAKRIEKIRIERRAWENGPGRDYVREKGRRRRARKKNNGWEKYTEQDVFNKYGIDCYLCQEPIDLNIPRTEPEGLNIEHVIPIAKGGPDTLENVRPSHGKCNQSKSDKDLEEFLRHRDTTKA